MPVVTGGSMGGGGADLELQFELAGLEPVVEKFEEIAKEVEAGKRTIAEAQVRAAEVLREQAHRVSHEYEEIHAGLKGTGRAEQEKIYGQVLRDYEVMASSINQLREEAQKLMGMYKDDWEDEERKAKKEAGEAEKGRGELAKKLRSFVAVGEQAAGLMRGAASRLMGAGTLGAGGFISLLAYGVFYESKIQAETARYSQLWDSVADSTLAAGTAGADAYKSKLASQLSLLTRTFRMSEGEARAATKALTDAGIGAKEAYQKTNIMVSGARASVLIATAAVDQYFRLAEGSAGRAAAKLVTEYGINVEAATEKIASMAIRGREAGVGVQNFMNGILDATGNVRQYGAVVDDTLLIAGALQRNLEEKGLEHHFSGALAMTTTGSVAAGLAGMSKGMQIIIAERMGLGHDIAAYYALKDALFDPKKGPGIFKEMTVSVVDLLKTGKSQSKAELAYAIEAILPQVGPQQAALLVDASETLRNTNATKEERGKAEKTFNAIWAKEQSRTADWRVEMEEIMRGMAQVGLALFNLLTIGLGQIIVLFKVVPLALALRIPGASTLLEFVTQGRWRASDAEAQYERWSDLLMEGSEAGEQAVDELGVGLRTVGRAIKKMMLPQGFAGTEALQKAFGLPGNLERADIETMFERGGPMLEQARRIPGVQAPGLPGGGGIDISAAQEREISAAARGGGMPAVQEALAGMVAEADPRSRWTPSRIVVTSVEPEYRAGGGTRLHIRFVVLRTSQEAAAVRGAAQSYQAEVTPPGLTPYRTLRRMGARYGQHEIDAAVDTIARENPELPRHFIRAMANMESGSRGAFGPGAGREATSTAERGYFEGDKIAVGPFGVLTKGGRQLGQGRRGPTTEQLLDPLVNARAWAPLALVAWRKAKAKEPELKAMGRTVEEGARLILQGGPGFDPTARSFGIRTAEGVTKLPPKEVSRRLGKMRRAVEHYEAEERAEQARAALPRATPGPGAATPRAAPGPAPQTSSRPPGQQ